MCSVDVLLQPARPPLHNCRCQRHEPRIGLAGFGHDSFLTGVGLLEQARQLGLGLVEADGDGQAQF